MNKYQVIGLMSGTSLDGLDLAYCVFEKKGSKWAFSIEAAQTIGYSDQLKSELSNVDQLNGLDLLVQDRKFGKFLGEKVKEFCSEHSLKPEFVSSHGHTIYHQPNRNLTFQMGQGASINSECNLPVIYDFRSLDVALGGQGAPLVPIGDELLFSDYEFCLNLGGISNISFNNKAKRLAFDISPCNILLNQLAGQLGLEFDPEGRNAAKGEKDERLFNALNQLPYYSQAYPKSIGIEWIRASVFPLLDVAISIENKLGTVCHHIAFQLAEVVKQNSDKSSKVLVTGGGAFNDFLIKLFKQYSGNEISYILPERKIIMFKEALIFAFLGVLKYRGEVNCLKSVTGARIDCSGGSMVGF